jgi:hypothetical protein
MFFVSEAKRSGHPGFDVLFRLHLEVEPHFLFQFAVKSISPQMEEQTAPEL